MATTGALVVIDGSHGEGGGALLRTALSMATLTQQALRIEHVRGGTRHIGLDVEDVALLSALSRICRADMVGAEDGSNVVTFLPKAAARGFNGTIEAVRTESGRGPNALVVLGSLLPVLARAGMYSTVSAEGETYGHNSISYDYFATVTAEALRKIGLFCLPDLIRPGFGRDSDGLVQLDIEPSSLMPIDWTERGSLRSVTAQVSTSGLAPSIGDRAAGHLRSLAASAGLKIDIEQIDFGLKHTGAFVTVSARYERGMGGGTAMGSRGLKAETLAQAAFTQCFEWMRSSATVDEFLADQILLPLVLAEGNSAFSVPRLTQRLLTSIWVIKQFLPIHITVKGTEGGPGSITIQR